MTLKVKQMKNGKSNILLIRRIKINKLIPQVAKVPKIPKYYIQLGHRLYIVLRIQS